MFDVIDKDVSLLAQMPIGKYLSLDSDSKRWSIAQYSYLLTKHYGIDNPTMEQTLQFIKNKAYEFPPYRTTWDKIISVISN